MLCEDPLSKVARADPTVAPNSIFPCERRLIGLVRNLSRNAEVAQRLTNTHEIVTRIAVFRGCRVGVLDNLAYDSVIGRSDATGSCGRLSLADRKHPSTTRPSGFRT